MNRINKKDRRRASAFLPFFFVKEHYIDKLYRDGLSDFTIPPSGSVEFLATALEQHTTAVSVATQTISTATFWGSKLSYIAACCGTAAITGTVCWLSMSVNSPLNRDDSRMNGDTIIVGDTLTYSPTPANTADIVLDAAAHEFFATEASDSSHLNFEKTPDNDSITAPVVIRRQIIQHQTVVVRDTVFILE